MKDGAYHLSRCQAILLRKAQPSYALSWVSWLFRRSPKSLSKAVTILTRDLYQVVPFSHNGHVSQKSHLLLPKRKQTGLKNRDTMMSYEMNDKAGARDTRRSSLP